MNSLVIVVLKLLKPLISVGEVLTYRTVCCSCLVCLMDSEKRL